MKKLIALAFLLTSCSMFQEPEFKVDNEFEPYVESFFDEAEIRGFDLKTNNLEVIKEKDLSKNHHAKAMIRWHGKQLIIVVDEEWADFNLKNYPKRVESVLFHELGHGILKREHITGCYTLMFDGGCEACYENNNEARTRLVDELFHPCH